MSQTASRRRSHFGGADGRPRDQIRRPRQRPDIHYFPHLFERWGLFCFIVPHSRASRARSLLRAPRRGAWVWTGPLLSLRPLASQKLHWGTASPAWDVPPVSSHQRARGLRGGSVAGRVACLVQVLFPLTRGDAQPTDQTHVVAEDSSLSLSLLPSSASGSGKACYRLV